MRPCTGDATSGVSVRTTSRPDVLERILGAAHAAPSVGHSQPWRFVIVRDAATRDEAALMADREWHLQAQPWTTAPVARCSTCSCTASGTRRWASSCAAIAGRRPRGCWAEPPTSMPTCGRARRHREPVARGQGRRRRCRVGHPVPPRRAGGARRAPAGVETLGWLCIGWPDERPPEPGLERAGWSSPASRSPTWCSSSAGDDEATPPPPPRSAGARPRRRSWRPGTSPTCC